mmetsp:Transcript_150933/g.485040  ORF Transcript_150933/g.485040 Transcript_150933/m.485040 type:complete len:251 (-) Transcript_150933:51-803(-)
MSSLASAGGRATVPQQQQPRKRKGADELSIAEPPIDQKDLDILTNKGALTLFLTSDLQCHKMLRAAFASLWAMCLCPGRTSIVDAAIAEGTKYDREVKSRGQGHGLGSPHTHIFLAVAAAPAGEAKLDEDERQFWKALDQSLDEDGQQAVVETIPHFKVKAACTGKGKEEDKDEDEAEQQGDTYKITISIDPFHPHNVRGMELKGHAWAVQIRVHLNAALLKLGGEWRTGQPPKSQLERLLEARLKKLQG